MQSYLNSLARSTMHLTRDDRPETFTMHQREWALLDEVFAPIYSPSSDISLHFLNLVGETAAPRSGSFLEIGCGTGIISVHGALAGYERVVAADINECAVENTRLNADRHGVSDRVTALRSDLFASLDPQDRFDTIFWSSNYVLAPTDYEYGSVHERAYMDAGYRAHRGYLSEAVDHLTGTGSALLHFSSRGDIPLLRKIAAECGRELRTLESRTVVEGQDVVEHMLLEITPARTRKGGRPFTPRNRAEARVTPARQARSRTLR
ncbi:methyltransferase domain-containing protein [Streptomyces sp. SID7909]|nr:methyltransferase domain-containing protein [Streptomyces sp. SID7909]